MKKYTDIALRFLMAFVLLTTLLFAQDYSFNKSYIGEFGSSTFNFKVLTYGTPIDMYDMTLGSGEVGTIFLSYIEHVVTSTPNIQNHSGLVLLQGYNNNGTVACKTSDFNETTLASAGTLTDVWASTAGTGKCTFTLTVNTSLMSVTTVHIHYALQTLGHGTVTRL